MGSLLIEACYACVNPLVTETSLSSVEQAGAEPTAIYFLNV